MEDLVGFIRDKFSEPESFIPLHAPVFIGNEKKYLEECIDSTFVSSVGKFVNKFEEMMQELTGAKYAVATTNGTAALHIALHAIGVSKDDEVITQALTFVATCNAISYVNGSPVFIDVDKDTMGMSPTCLNDFLENHCEVVNGDCINKTTGNKIKACVPMHTFGFPCRIDEIVEVCTKWNIIIIEDSAESLGSYVNEKHTGTFGKIGVFSFNGNKVVTAGGGGCVVTNDEGLAKRIKHITTTAKEPHKWAYKHDEIGFNYRMPNLNAALICAQLESLSVFLDKKRSLATSYKSYFEKSDIDFKWERKSTQANYWLNTIIFPDQSKRDEFLGYSNSKGVMTRPAWELMHMLPMFKDCERGNVRNAVYLAERIVNIPSSVII